MFCSFIVFLSLPHDRVKLFSFFDFGWELFVYPYSGSSELLGSSSSDEFPVFKVGEFSYDFPRVFVELVPFPLPVDSFGSHSRVYIFVGEIPEVSVSS